MALAVATRLCACGCGLPAPDGRTYRYRHTPGQCPNCGRQMVRGRSYGDCPCRDETAVAYYTGQADARYGRPRYPAGARWEADAYTRGYDDRKRGEG